MKKIILTLFLFCYSLLASAQETNERFSIALTGVSLKTAIEKIEATTKYRFFFDSEWIENDHNLYTNNLKDARIEDVLNGILDQTELNYLIDGTKIILTKNLKIRTDLYTNISNLKTQTEVKKETSELTNKPVYQKQFDAITNNIKVKEVEETHYRERRKNSKQKIFHIIRLCKKQ